MTRKVLISVAFLLVALLGHAQEKRLFWPAVSPAVDSFMVLLDDNRQNVNDLQLELCRKLEHVTIDKKKARVVAWRVKFWQAKQAMMRDHQDVALRDINAAAEMVDRRNYEYDYQRIVDLQKFVVNTIDNSLYQKYVDCYNGIDYFLGIGDLRIAADNYNYMGIILSQLDEHILALENFKKAEDYYRQANTQIEMKGIRLNMANCYLFLGEEDKAKSLLVALERDPMVRGLNTFYVNVLSSLCEVYDGVATREREQVVAKLEKAVAGCSIPSLTLQYRLCKGDFLRDAHQYAAAIAYYGACLQTIPYSAYASPQVVQCLKNMGKCYSYTQQQDSALKYMSLYVNYSDSLRAKNPVSSMQKMESLSKIRSFEQQLSVEKEKQRSRLLLMIVLVVMVAIIFTSLFVYKYEKEKIQRKLKETENRELALTLENSRLKAEEQQLEIELRNRQLMERTLVISEKDNALKGLRRILAETEQDVTVDKNTLQRINAELGMHIDTDDEWEFFRRAFEEINPDFYVKLKEMVPKITENEKRLCAYLLIGLPRKQIAFMLNVQPDSVKKAITRLRKKLQLDPETNIEDYLLSI